MHNVWMDQAEDKGREETMETEELAESPKRFAIYRLTDWVWHPSEVDHWLPHFKVLGRHAGILLFDAEFSVWVQGREFIGPPEIPNTEPPKGVPVNWVNDFLIFYPHPRGGLRTASPKIREKHGWNRGMNPNSLKVLGQYQWKPGESGNPAGRPPRIIRQVSTRCP